MAYENNQSDFPLPAGGNEGSRKSENLLPKYFRTDANSKFLQATLDQLVQPGVAEKLNGYYGRQISKAYNADDNYVGDISTQRENYQFEPVTLIKDELDNVTFYKDYNDYLNQIKSFGGNTENQEVLNSQEYYAWQPHVDWDKFSNFREYYWLPYGPQTVRIAGQERGVESTVEVSLFNNVDNVAYKFSSDELVNNPTLILYKGQTYTFDIDAIGTPITFKTKRTLESSFNYNDGVSAQGVEKGTVTFEVDVNAPEVLYYVAENDINNSGLIQIKDIDENTDIDVEKEILGKKKYKSSNGIQLSTGMKVSFAGFVTPEKYATGDWYVEGVGSNIKLVPENELSIPGSYSDNRDVAFDTNAFDRLPFANANGYPATKDYIVVNRSSNDRNMWSRYNRWFHKNVIEESARINGQEADIDQNARATRPIIEFNANLKLFNFGTSTKNNVNVIDTFTKDIFSTVEGAVGYNIDGIDLVEGMRVLFTAEEDIRESGKIFKVKFITQKGRRQISLIEEPDTAPLENETVLALDGLEYKGRMFYYDGNAWNLTQEKTKVNQPPLFDLFDSNGISYGDSSTYPNTTFAGNKIFSYREGTGTNDSQLGFPITYRSIENIGDIVFDFNLLNSSFTYTDATFETVTASTDVCTLQQYKTRTDYSSVNGWIKANTQSTQRVLRQYVATNNQTSFVVDVFDNSSSLSDLDIKVTVNNNLKFETTDYVFDKTETNVIVRFNTPLLKDDVVVFRCRSSATKNANGIYELPINLERNPLNNDITTFTLGEVNDHVTSIVQEVNDFFGVHPGPGNLRDIGNLSTFGRKFVQHSGPTNLALYHITDKSANIIKAIDFNRREYAKFKRLFIQTSLGLGFDGTPKAHVDLIFAELNKNKTSNLPFYFSDMVPTGGARTITYDAIPGNVYYALNAIYDITEPSVKAVTVYIDDEQLVFGQDYTFNTDGFCEITKELTAGQVITINEYETTDGSYVPPTPTKLGLYPKFAPVKFIDNSYTEPTEVIQGHDGSITKAYGDFRDDLILEFEKRIYNNIRTNYNSDIIDIHDFIPGTYRNTTVTKENIDNVMLKDFASWLTNIDDVDYTAFDFYNRSNSFSYNYSSMQSPLDTALPGYWRGVYKQAYDTDRPHTHPWEMLGLTSKPSWWETVYGPAPYTSNNLLLWEDLEKGIIAKPGVNKVVLEKYKRPGLTTHIPVNDLGQLLSPLDSGYAKNYVNGLTRASFVFGDEAPVETAWRRSSEYAFSLFKAWMLNQPTKIIGLGFDRLRTIRDNSNQIVYSSTSKRMRLVDLVYPNNSTTGSDSVRVFTSGFVNFIANYLASNVVSNYETYQNNVASITNQVAFKVGGFTDKSKFNLLLDSRTPLNQGNVFVPEENYQITLQTSSPIDVVTYSGVVIEKASAGYIIRGYDSSNPSFKYYNYVPNQNDPLVNVGGVSDSFIEWDSDKRYVADGVVKYQETFYRVTTAHTSDTIFDQSKFAKLPDLPVVGGRSAQFRTRFDSRFVKQLPYGTLLRTTQEVVDFLLGYGDYLQKAGFVFDNFNPTLEAVENWKLSAKEFMFWTLQNWDAGSLITVSPSAQRIEFSTSYAVVDDIFDPFYEYGLVSANGTKLRKEFVNILRTNENTFSLTVKNTADGIYALKLPLVQKEHVVVLDNETVFKDIIYDQEAGYRQERIRVLGYRTADWAGGLNIPGFIYDDAIVTTWQQWKDYAIGDAVKYKEFYYAAITKVTGTELFVDSQWYRLEEKPQSKLLTNLEYKTNQFGDFYDLDTDNFDVNQQEIAQHLIGYQKREYLANIINDDVSQYKFYQGMIADKGTKNVLTKLFDALSSADKESLEFYEEWAVRSGQYGASDGFEELEFLLDEEQFQLSPQPILLTETIPDDVSDLIYRQLPGSVFVAPNGYAHKPFPVKYVNDPALKTAGYVRQEDVNYTVKTFDDILNIDHTVIKQGQYVWVTFDKNDWNVYKYTDTPCTIQSAIPVDNDAVLVLDRLTTVKVNDIVGLYDVTEEVQGFFKVKSVELNRITITLPEDVALTTEATGLTGILTTFVSNRVATLADANAFAETDVEFGETLWVDSITADGKGKWNVIKAGNSFDLDENLINPVENNISFGESIANDSANTVVAVGSPLDGDGKVYIYERQQDGSTTFGTLQPKQVIEPIANYSTTPGKFGQAMSMSPDGEYLVVTAPNSSNVKTAYKDEFTFATDYKLGSIVQYNGNLYKSRRTVKGRTDNVVFGTFDSASRWRSELYKLHGTYDDIPLVALGDLPLIDVEIDHILVRAPLDAYEGSNIGDTLYLDWNELSLNYTPDVKPEIVNIELTNPVRLTTNSNHSLADGDQVILTDVPNDNLSFRPIAFPYLYDNSDINTPFDTVQQSSVKGIEGTKYYAKVLTNQQIELYSDEALTIKVNGSVGFVGTANIGGFNGYLNKINKPFDNTFSGINKDFLSLNPHIIRRKVQEVFYILDPVNVPSVSAGDRVTTATGNADVVRVRNELGRLVIYADRKNGVFDESGTLYINDQFLVGSYTRPLADNVDRSTILGGYWEIPLASGFIPKDQQLTNTPTTDSGEGLVIVDIKNNYNPATLPGVGWTESTARLPYKSSIQNTLEHPVEVLSSTSKAFKKETDLIRVLSHKSQGVAGNVTEVDVLDPRFVVRLPKNVSDKAVSATADGTTPNPYVGVYLNDIPANGVLPDISDTGFGADPYAIINVDKRVLTDLWNGYIDYDVFAEVDLAPGDIIREGQSGATAVITFIQRDLDKSRLYVKDVAGEFSFGSRYIDGLAPQSMWLYKQIGANLTRIGTTESRQLADEDIGYLAVFTHTTNLSIPPKLTFAVNSITDEVADYETKFITGIEYQTWIEEFKPGLPRVTLEPSTENNDWAQVDNIPINIGRDASSYTKEGAYFVYQNNSTTGQYDLVSGYILPNRANNRELGHSVKLIKDNNFYKLVINSKEAHTNDGTDGNGRLYFVLNGTSEFGTYNWSLGRDPDFKGEYNTISSYYQDQVVIYNDVFYRALTNLSNEEFTPIKWKVIGSDIDFVGYLPNTSGLVIPGDDSSIINLSTSGYGEVFDISDNGRVLATVARYDSGNKLVIYTLKDMHFQYVTEFTAPTGSDGYGNSITVSDNGNLIVVSAPGADARESQQGKVFVYKNVAGTYSLQQELNSPNAELVEGFGQTLGFDGNQLIVTGATSDILLDTTFDRYENRDTTRNDYVNDPTKGFNVAETTYDNGFTTFVKRVSDSGNVYVYENINDTLVFGQRLKYSNFNVKNFGKNAIVNNNTILVGLPALDVTGNIQGQVAVYIKDDIDSTWSVYREPVDPADLNKFRGSFVYDTKQNDMLTRLDILDPILGKIPGTAEQELSYKTYYDPANYNVGFTNNKEQYIAWDDRNKGKLWWDLSTVKYIDYHQGSITYSQNTFNKLAEGASIDIYEWVESNILPSAWDSLADTNRGTALGISGTSKYGDTKYATQEIYDSVGQVFTTKYYFWVKATKVLPQIEGRNLTAYDIQNIITDPAGQKLKFVTVLGNDRFVLYNCNNLVSDTDVAINFRYWTIENQDNNIHTEYQIVTDGFETSKPKSSIEQKWFDSLIGSDRYGRAVPDPALSVKQKYGNLNRPRQSWFVNRKEALKQFIERVNRVLIKELAVDNLDLTKLSNKDPRPTLLSGMFDSIIDTEAELRFVGTVRAEQTVLEPVIVDGTVTKIKVITRGRGYKNLPKITINGTGSDLELTPVLNNIGAVTSVTIVNGGTNYTDDLTLTVRPLSTLVRSDSTLGGKWSIYAWDNTTRNWTISNQQSYDVAEYWNYKDWYADGYSELTSVDYLIDNLYELNIIQDSIGDIIKISSVGTGGWILLEKIVNVDTPDYSSGYKTVGRENGTLEFLSKLYTQDGGSLELRKILETIRDDLFVDELANEYNQLFFAGLRYVFTEQNYVDWAFKTSFIKAKHNVGELKEKTTYQNDNLPSFEKYIEEVKPYRTKVREYLSAYDKTDNTQSVVTDFELSPFYDPERSEIVSPQVKINDGVLSGINFDIDQYPQKHWVDNFTYSVEEIKIENGGSGFTNIPQVTITGGGGTGATASAYIGSGSVKNIVITNSGSGFTSIPTITIDGVQDEDGTPPKVSIVLGNKKVRSLNVTQKFDRLSPNLEILNLPETELFTSTGTELTLTLKFPMDLTRTNVRVFFNDTEALSSQYSFNNKELFSTNKTHIRNQGYITLTNAQLVGTIIRVEYNKDISMLTAADRINLFYNATDGQLGKDLGQLMDGVDYGGVEVKSFEFGQDLGWDTKEWYTTSWDSYDENFDDESFVTTGPTFRFQLSKPLEEDAIYNVYVNATRVDDPNYDGSTKTYIAGDGSTVLSLGNPNAIMLSITSDSTEYVVENGKYYIDIQNVEEWEEFFASEGTPAVPAVPGGVADPEYNNGAISNVVGDGSDFFKREVTTNGVRVMGAGTVGGQTAVPDAWLEKVARMFELFTDSTGAGINETYQRNLIKTLSGDAGTYHAGLPTIQRVARGSGAEYTPNFLTDAGVISWNLTNLFDTHVQNDMVWYLNSTGDGYGDGDIDAQEVIEHVFHTLHMHGLPADDIKLYQFLAADWQTGDLYAAMEEAYDAGKWDPSGYQANPDDWKTDADAFEVAAKEYLYLLNFSMFEYTELWDGGSLAPEWSDDMRTQAGIQANNPLGYAFHNTYIAPVISKPSLATIRSIFQDGNTPAQDDPSLAGASGYIVDVQSPGSPEIPAIPGVASNPTITFRKSTSDGSFLPEGIGFDSLIEGGNLQYGTATGIDAGDINLDGDGFVTPTTSKGPEELVPGQLHDTLDLKVYDRSADGGSLISTRNYTATDGQVNFDLDVLPHNIFSAIVKVNGKILQSEDVPGSDSSVVGTPEYSINFTDKKLILRDALVAGDKVNVLSMAGSGERILDTDHFIGDGTTRTFVTSVIWVDGIQSYINVDGANAQVSLFKTDSSYGDKAGLVGLDFVIPPSDNAFVYYSLFDTNEETIQRYSEVIIDRFIGDGSTVQFELSPEPASRLPLSHNIIVKVDDKILFPGYTQQWYITTAREYVLDRSQYPTSSLSPDAVDVYINGVKKVLLKDYRWNFNNSSVTLFDNVGETGDDLEIVITDSAEYEFSKNTLIGLPTVTGTFEPGEIVEIGTGDSTVYTATVKSFTTGTGNLVVVGTVPGLSQAVDIDNSIPIVGLTSNATASSIVSITLVEAGDRLVLDSIPADGTQVDVYKFNRHELQDIQMETKTNVSRSILTVGTDDYYEFNRLTKGLVKLRAPAVDTAYLWISLNGILLTPNVDYKLVKMDNYVQIDRPVKPNDKIQVIHFAADKASEKFGYRMFKDMLNRTHYKRLNQANVYFLAEPLSISDQAIQLTDVQGITQPSKELNVPGVIFVNGERIEYFEVVGKELRQLRRGTLGTGPADTYPAGTEIMDQSNSETIPYTDEMVSSIALDDESTQILLDWIPTKGVDEFEVFVAGRRLRKNSISMYQNQVVDANGIVTTELIAKDSPEGDITLAPEFTLNITDSSATVTLADAPVTGTRVVIVRKVGKTWQTPGEQLRYANNSIAEFIREATTDLPK